MNKKILPPTYFIILFLLSIGLHFSFPIKNIILYPYNYLGFIFIIFGSVINFWADYLFKKKNTAVKPFEKPSGFIVKGPFSISRNPMYLGFTSILFGLAILLGSIIAFLMPFALIIILERKFIVFEEKNLEEVFGKEYLDYKKRVRKWL
jgi:protein-S-isoprenylcysteine O-methyltransferase Ste14